MQNTRHHRLSAAHGADWFRLTRHDEPEPADPAAPAPEADPAPDPAEPEPEGADQLGDKGKQALDRMKAEKTEARRVAAAEKKRADDLARKVEEFEDRDKSELDKATDKAQRMAEQAAKATRRAVIAEVRAAASAFADPEDAAAFLDLTSYANDDGDIDTETIAEDLAALLERKPHLRRAAPEASKPPAPKPDPGQGARPEAPAADFRTASRADFEAELAKAVPGFRLRS